MRPSVVAVCARPGHAFSKTPVPAIRLLTGLGIEGDGHSGATVQHRSRVARDPSQPNLRQVHLLHEELFAELAGKGYLLRAGDIGENILTRDVDLLGLATGARLVFPGGAAVEVTGLRNPCVQLDLFAKGLTAATLGRAADGSLIRKAGVMAIVVSDGAVAPGDAIAIVAPAGPARPLAPV